jgi:hypothetical protein
MIVLLAAGIPVVLRGVELNVCAAFAGVQRRAKLINLHGENRCAHRSLLSYWPPACRWPDVLKARKGSKDRKDPPDRPDRQVRLDLKETKVFRGPLVSPGRRVRLARQEAWVRPARPAQQDRSALLERPACMRSPRPAATPVASLPARRARSSSR